MEVDDIKRGVERLRFVRYGDQWLPVSTTSAYATARNAWNTVEFSAVTTPALRLELTMQQGFSAGLQEWKVK